MSIRLSLARRKTARMQAQVQSKLDKLGRHSRDLKAYMRAYEDFKRLRDSEPEVKCERCTATMHTGDYRCHACGTPNPHHVDRGVDPPKFPVLS